MNNSLLNTRTILLTGILVAFATVSLSTTAEVSAATMGDHMMNTSVSSTMTLTVKQQAVVDSVSMKIDMLSLEDTKRLWTVWTKFKGKISMDNKNYWLVDWLDGYIKWSVEDKSMMEDDMMDMMMGNTIADLAMGNSDLSMLVDIVVYLDLADALKAEGNWTVFAPTNAAFAQALETLDMTAEELMADKELLKKIVMHHIVDMKVTAQDAMDLPYGTLVTTASGETIRVRTGDGVWIDGAMVVSADMMASNGIVHVIDKVLLPPTFVEMNGMMTDRGDMNIAEVAMGSDMFTTLVAGIQAADLADMLMMEGPYTVFAPTNEAFVELLQANNMTASELLADKEMLKEVISYHVVSGFYTSADIMGMEMNAMWKTANGASIDVNPVGMVNTATIVQADIYASNGVVHAIDEVLMPQ